MSNSRWTMNSLLVLLLLLAGWGACLGPLGRADTPVMRMVQAKGDGVSLLQNGGFEQWKEGRPEGWSAAPQGLERDATGGRQGSTALKCANPAGSGWLGASQTLHLNRTEVAPLIVSGWSRADQVGGASDSGYSLYVDLIYEDGTPLWGQTANFTTGTHDWQQRQRLILPEKPVRSLTVHCLFRGHAGRVWFDDVTIEEVVADQGAVLFQGVPMVVTPQESIQPKGPEIHQETQDGLALTLRDGMVTSVQVSGRLVGRGRPAGFLARDAASGSDLYAFHEGKCADLGLEMQSSLRAQSDCVVVEGRLQDTTGQPRAVTLVFAVPLQADGWHWGEDIRRSRRVRGGGEFTTHVAVQCGATGTMSQYPLAALWNEEVGLACALDMNYPAVYRLGYHAGTEQLFIAYDFGLVKESGRFAQGVPFRFVLYAFDPAWGFRAAYDKFMRLFPEHFLVRSREQGIWMPFTDVSTVQGWQDFGFRYHEGNNNVRFDDQHNILSFRYTEPMTWWMPMEADVARTVEKAHEIRTRLAEERGRHQRMAEVSRTAAMFDETGQPCLLFREEPWCRGAVWSLNPNPWLGQGQETTINAGTCHWNDSLREQLYGTNAAGRLDGEYLDSLEGYVTAELNFRNAHFKDTTVPLTFSTDSRRPALFKGLAVYEFTRWLAGEVHDLGQLTFANGVPYRFAFLCPWLDIMGTETDWLQGGPYRPPPDARMAYWRTMAGQKPYLLLMNTDYDRFTPELVEKYFQRALFYGMYPSMFSHNAAENPYWKNPAWYNRDRPLFKKYIPLIKNVAEAGWQPLTHLRCDNPALWVERFGPDPQGNQYWTVHNDTAQRQEGRLLRDKMPAMRPETLKVTELVRGTSWEPASPPWAVALQPQETQVVWIQSNPE